MDQSTAPMAVGGDKPWSLPRHAEAPPDEVWHEWAEHQDRPLAVDLFCGAGGLSWGLEAAGYRVALSVDTDAWSLESHSHNFPGRAVALDLGTEDGRDAVVSQCEGLDIDLVAGGPPCQPFSLAGRAKLRSLVETGARDANDQRRELWQSFLDVVERLEPRVVLMENVPDMALGDDMMVVRLLLDRLEQSGYQADARIVGARGYGVPQQRRRLIVVGMRGGPAFDWPRESEISEAVSVRDAIGDLPALRVIAERPVGSPELSYSGEPGSEFARKARKDCFGDAANLVHDHYTRPVRSDDLEAFSILQPGMKYGELPERLRRYRRDIFNDKYNRLSWEGLSRTITAHLAKDGYWYIHPGQPRTISVREAARLQTFPDSFRFAGARSHQFRQIGNAVPPTLAEAMGTALIDGLRDSIAEKDKSNHGGSDRLESVEAVPSSTPPDIRGDRAAVREHLAGCAKSLDLEGIEQEAIEGSISHGRSIVSESLLASAAWVSLLAGETTRLVASAPVLRAVSRLMGYASRSATRRSDLRLELAKLAGSGENAGYCNAALHCLGRAICKPTPNCEECPMRNACVHHWATEIG
ncbi:DNA (cytosine-5-)-methyltransferase [Candidatus Poriferisodalis sp.]|uniref:DNA cytosine methyltransferase n=1 Tax=Candidatus Poriferisodalis sp. TaxID=3101277 RepID=UPI003B011552